MVDGHHWITQQQLVDAVAVGQVRRVRSFPTATFIGYQIGGLGGAIAATIGIFLPAFLLVGATHGFAARLRTSRALSRVLDGLNLASNALLIGVLVTLIRALDLTAFNLIVAGARAGRPCLPDELGPTTVLAGAALLGVVWHGL